jgi:hypothetical protein
MSSIVFLDLPGGGSPGDRAWLTQPYHANRRFLK